MMRNDGVRDDRRADDPAEGEAGVQGRRRIGALLVVVAVSLVFALPSVAAGRPSDASIDARVKEAVRDDPRVGDSAIEVTTRDGIVTLGGTVHDLAAKRFADREAKKLAGVRGVIDEVSVRPDERLDSDIAADVVARLWDRPDMSLRGLDVDVKDGIVTLSGSVGGFSEKQEAELLASEVRGVREVRNELALEYPSSRSDDAIRQDIVSAIGRDAYLVGLPIEVSVREGRVTLNGSVGNAYQRERAAEAAWVANVRDVKNDLAVEWWEDPDVRKAPPMPSDKELAGAVRDVLHEDLRLAHPFEIEVTASEGDVTLRGTVPTYEQKLRASKDGLDVAGVAWVTNHLQVRPGWRSDDAIRSQIMRRFDEDYMLHGHELAVRVNDGVVTLSGTTANYRERSHAVDVASRVPGVVEVADHLRVDWVPRFSDSELATRIRGRLREDGETRWVADRIHVSVDDGVGRLTGDVSTWDERLEAGRIAALTDGVRWIDNRVTVEGVDYPWDERYYPGDGFDGGYALSAR